MARLDRELKAAIHWLSSMKGLIFVAEIRKRAPVSWRTVVRAKKMLKMQSKQLSKAWVWIHPGTQIEPTPAPKVDFFDRDHTPKPVSNDPFAVPGVEPIDKTKVIEEDDFVPDQCNTDELKILANNLIMMGKEIPEMVTEMCLTCAEFPMPKPYSRAYIRSVAEHVMNGTPIRTDLDQNIEQPTPRF